MNYTGQEYCLNITELLKERLLKNSFQCIVAVNNEYFISYIRNDSTWKKVFHPVWIHEVDRQDKIPFQL